MEKKMNPTWFVLGGAVVLLIAVVAYVNGQKPTQPNQGTQSSNTITVAASTYVLQELAALIGGKHITLLDIGSGGAGAHDFEPTPRVVAEITNADLFVFHGAGLDEWAQRVHEDVEANGGTAVEALELFEENELMALAEEEERGNTDPHVWLSPVKLKTIAGGIRDALIAADPAHKTEYTQNATVVLTRLDRLHSDITDGLAACERNTIVVAHDAFSYFAAEYNLTIHSIAGLSPDAEPSAQRLAELTDLVKEEGISYIFFETLTSPKLAETLATETGAQTLVLNPIEGLTSEDEANNATYFTFMRDNLANLQKALTCKTP